MMNITNITSNSNSAPLYSISNILIIIIGLLAVFLNGVLLLAIARNASLIFKNNGAYLVANVAVADLFTGVFSLVYGIIVPQVKMSPIGNHVLQALFWTSVETSLITVFVMSLIRYIAIVYPFKAETWLSKKCAIRSCVLVWVFSLFCGIFTAFYADIGKFCLAILFEITIIATAFLYYKIFTKLAQRKQVPLVTNSPTTTVRLSKELRREYQLTSVVVALTVIMVVTVLPHMIGGQIYISGKLFTSSGHGSSSVLTFVTYYLPIELTNFVLNPCVYAWRLPKYRHALLRTLKCYHNNRSSSRPFKTNTSFALD